MWDGKGWITTSDFTISRDDVKECLKNLYVLVCKEANATYLNEDQFELWVDYVIYKIYFDTGKCPQSPPPKLFENACKVFDEKQRRASETDVQSSGNNVCSKISDFDELLERDNIFGYDDLLDSAYAEMRRH